MVEQGLMDKQVEQQEQEILRQYHHHKEVQVELVQDPLLYLVQVEQVVEELLL